MLREWEFDDDYTPEQVEADKQQIDLFMTKHPEYVSCRENSMILGGRLFDLGLKTTVDNLERVFNDAVAAGEITPRMLDGKGVWHEGDCQYIATTKPN